jgi:hypothetical protein
MGVIRAMILAPSHPSHLAPDVFVSLLADLTSSNLLERPYTVIQGMLPTYPSGLSSYRHKGVGAYDKVSVPFQGDDPTLLLDQVSQLLAQTADFCVLFPGFDLTNEQLASSFEALGFFNADVALYSFHAPVPIEIQYFRFFEGDPFHGEDVTSQLSLSQYFCSVAKGGPEGVANTPLEPIMLKHFGLDMQVHKSYW